jgi:hypothetical protein
MIREPGAIGSTLVLLIIAEQLLTFILLGKFTHVSVKTYIVFADRVLGRLDTVTTFIFVHGLEL